MIVDVCSAEAHDAVKADAAAFSLLHPLGTSSFDYEDGGEVEHFIVANCHCGSTLYRRCTRDEAVAAAVPMRTQRALATLRQEGLL